MESFQALEKIFSEAVQGRSSLDIGDATIILESLHIDAGDGDANGLPFTRTRNDCDEQKVKKLLKIHAEKNGKISERVFVRVGLRILLRERKM